MENNIFYTKAEREELIKTLKEEKEKERNKITKEKITEINYVCEKTIKQLIENINKPQAWIMGNIEMTNEINEEDVKIISNVIISIFSVFGYNLEYCACAPNFRNWGYLREKKGV